MISLRETAEGTVLEVKVRPKAGREGVEGLRDGRLVVSVTEAPEKDKANKALAKVIAEFFGISASRLILRV